MSESIKVENKGFIATYYFIVWVLIPIMLFKGIDKILIFGGIIYRLYENKSFFKVDYSLFYQFGLLSFFTVILLIIKIIIVLMSQYKMIELKKKAVSWLIIALSLDIIITFYMSFISNRYFYYIDVSNEDLIVVQNSILFFIVRSSILIGCIIYNKYKDEYKDPFVN